MTAFFVHHVDCTLELLFEKTKSDTNDISYEKHSVLDKVICVEKNYYVVWLNYVLLSLVHISNDFFVNVV